MKRWAILLCGALLSLFGAQTARADDFFGMNVNTLFQPGVVNVDLGQQLSAVQASGIRLARTDAYWAWGEPTAPNKHGKHHYSADKLDEVATDLASHDLRWLPILTYSPLWAASEPGNDHSPPSDDADFSRGAGLLAGRYGSKGTFWTQHPELPRLPFAGYEIWNEPDLSIFWSPKPDPARYAQLYIDARSAIKPKDPVAPVIVGGLAPYDADDFIRAMYASHPELKGHVDAVGFHPYASSVDRSLGDVANLRKTLNGLGEKTVPIYITEVGWTTHGESASLPDATRGADIALLGDVLSHSDCDVKSYIPYTWVTPQQSMTDREQWYGIREPNGAPTESSLAYSAAVKRYKPGGRELRVCGVVSERSAATPLKLTLSLKRHGKSCWRAHVTYRGRSVNGVRVDFAAGSHHHTHHSTDHNGLASYCVRARSVSAKAAIGEAASSRRATSAAAPSRTR
jgi:polysaccharide biosynthesis protein PslG